MLLNVLGSITKDAKLKRIAAYSDGSIVGAAWKISLMTAKFVDQTRHMASTTPRHASDDFLRSASGADFGSCTLIDVSTTFMPDALGIIVSPNGLKVRGRSR